MGVGRELVAEPPVELLDRAVQAERALLDQVEEGNAEAAIALGDRDDEAQVGVDHLLLGDSMAALDPLGEGHLLGRAQQPVAGDLGEEELEPAFRPGGGELRELLRRRPFSGDAPA
jgi:hypothetical protein